MPDEVLGARAWVVVPAETAIADAGLHQLGGALRRSPPSRGGWRTDLAAKPGLGRATARPRASAPPWTFSSRPCAVQRDEVAAHRHVGDAEQARRGR